MTGGAGFIASTLVHSSQQNATSMMMVFSNRRRREEGGWRRGRLGGDEVALVQCPMWRDGGDVGWGVKGKIGAF